MTPAEVPADWTLQDRIRANRLQPEAQHAFPFTGAVGARENKSRYPHDNHPHPLQPEKQAKRANTVLIREINLARTWLSTAARTAHVHVVLHEDGVRKRPP
jgi:hypothetical protein